MRIQQLSDFLLAEFGIDLSVYSAPFLRKTVQQHMTDSGVSGIKEYGDFLAANAGALELLVNSFFVSYTLFFRNKMDMALLEEIILPGLLRSKARLRSPSVRIWSAGCSTGPEVYSLAMLTDAAAAKCGVEIPVMLFGTDKSAAAIEKARSAQYEYDVMLHVKLEYLEKYFKIRKSRFMVMDEIRQAVDLSTGDLTDPAFTSPPGSIFADFDLVSCCNLLIYYNPYMQGVILEKLHRALVRNGYLLVGESERAIVQKFGNFRLFSPFGNVFIRN